MNYLALLGWSISPDNDLFSMEELVAAFDIEDVNPNPARFDQKKCVAINAEHLRRLEVDDFARRCVPFLHREGFVSADSYDALTERERFVLDESAEMVQTRVQMLGEVPGMMGFLFREGTDITLDEGSVKKLKDNAGDVLTTAIDVINGLGEDEFTTAVLEEKLRAAIVEGMEIKPRLAFGPLRVAVTGRQVSPPLFESMEIIGREASVARLVALKEQLAG